ncbi:MAG: hypothetical protein Q4G34_03310 [Micrococcus sp.]|nr:hypothetical protein [Micrococcus sp.]
MPSSSAPRPDAAVFRRRRLLVGIGLVVVLLAIGVALGGVLTRLLTDDSAPAQDQPVTAPTTTAAAPPSPSPAGTSPQASPDATPESSPDGSLSPSPTAAPTTTAPAAPAAPACRSSDIRLTAATDQHAYAADEMPTFALRVVNLSSEACSLNVGTRQQRFVVSREDGAQVFSTRSCQAGARDQTMVLVPHDEQTASFEWNRLQDAGSCEEAGDPAGTGAYRLTVSLGGMTSQPVAFRLSTDGSASED